MARRAAVGRYAFDLKRESPYSGVARIAATEVAALFKGVCPLSSPSSPVFGKKYSAFLFDMDGTLLSSIEAAERVWGHWAESHGLDVATFLPTMHGKRGVDTIRQLGMPGVDPETEAAIITQREMEDVEGVRPLPGAIEFLKSLPPERWAIVTSSPRELAKVRIAAAGLPEPKFIVIAEDVSRGKPSPECYLLGAMRVGFDAEGLPGVRGCRGRRDCRRIGRCRRHGHHRHAHAPLRNQPPDHPRLHRHRSLGR